ncbi:MAG: YceD family protein [Candidatus Thiosymbion ectosymbiont of Robbea hypermnestra]|nr:YceD family protein [Candidatus Thiosymbion ectosymbiont of Robbea hypermnestra]
MSPVLPSLLDPWRAVDKGAVFAGRLPLSGLPRLRGLLLDAAGDVGFRLAFSRDEAGRGVLRCEVVATLRLSCQRCLEALEHRVETDTWLALVSGVDEERRLPERYDPLPVGDEPIRPGDLVEDELLLALPQIPMHEPVVCGRYVADVNAVPRGSAGASPFAVLAESVSGDG